MQTIEANEDINSQLEGEVACSHSVHPPSMIMPRRLSRSHRTPTDGSQATSQAPLGASVCQPPWFPTVPPLAPEGEGESAL